MANVEAVVLFAFLFLLVYIWSMRNKRSAVMEWPVIGMLPALIFNTSRLLDYVTCVLKQSNYTFEVRGTWFTKLNFIVTSDPENIHYIFSTHSANFNRGSTFKEIFEVLGDGILAAESDSWKMQRKLTHSLFRQISFLKLVDKISKQKMEVELFKILDHACDNGLEVDMQDLFHRFTFDVTCRYLLGSDLDSLSLALPDVPFAKALDDIGEVLLHRHLRPKCLWKLQNWLQLGLEKRAKNAIKTINSFIYEQIYKKQEQNNRNIAKGISEEEAFDLISSFMMDESATNKCHGLAKLDNTFLRDLVMNILFAGRDTSATALTWFFWLVSTNPLVESKIREEIEVTFQIKSEDPWRFPTYPKLNKLIFLHATLCETLRLYPPSPFNHKASVKPDILPSGHHVGKESEILISMYTMGRMEEIWGEDCSEFRPERWISEKKTILEVPSFKYNVFGAGPRTCVGKDLAFRGMKAVATAVIWGYNIRIIKDHPVIPANSFVLHMKHGLKVHVSKKGLS